MSQLDDLRGGLLGGQGRLGVSHDEAAQAIAEVLPQVVDRVSPEGQLPPEEDLDEAFGRLANTASDG